VTIDFDFFVKEDPAWDFGHQESLLFLNMIWESRVGLANELKTDGNERGFWKWLHKHSGVEYAPMCVSDSHAYACNIHQSINRVIIIDAHHDCWQGDSLGVDKRDRNIYCHNWLREWLLQKKGRSALWVKPVWPKDGLILPDDMKSRVKEVTWSKSLDLGLQGSTIVHVCRSGCWVPPWLDKAFLAFLRASGRPPERLICLQDGDWNPLNERWTEQEFQQILEREAKVQSRMKTLVAGQIRASDFLNCKVEVKK